MLFIIPRPYITLKPLMTGTITRIIIPKNISSIKSPRENGESDGVSPILSPTVPKADVHSKSAETNGTCSTEQIRMPEKTVTQMPITQRVNARRTV